MKIPVWSFSFLSNYLNCPAQANARYIEKTLPYVESEAAAYGNRVHSALEHAIAYNKPLDEDLKQYEKYVTAIKQIPAKVHAELKLGVTNDWKPTNFFGDDVSGRGKLDVVALLNDTTAILFDHKTGKVREDTFELEVQAVLLQVAYPKLTTIKGCYIWLKPDHWGEIHDLSSKIERTKETIEGIMRKVGQGLFYVNKNALCGWCALTSCKHFKERK